MILWYNQLFPFKFHPFFEENAQKTVCTDQSIIFQVSIKQFLGIHRLKHVDIFIAKKVFLKIYDSFDTFENSPLKVSTSMHNLVVYHVLFSVYAIYRITLVVSSCITYR